MMKAFEFSYFDEKYYCLANSQEEAEKLFNKELLDETEPEEVPEVREVTGNELNEKTILVDKIFKGKKVYNVYVSIQNFINAAIKHNQIEPHFIADTIGYL
jgi:hypothetical protein